MALAALCGVGTKTLEASSNETNASERPQRTMDINTKRLTYRVAGLKADRAMLYARGEAQWVGTTIIIADRRGGAFPRGAELDVRTKQHLNSQIICT